MNLDMYKRAGCPRSFFPSVLLKNDFSERFKTSIKSKVYPTLKTYLDDPSSIICVNTASDKVTDALLGFGYLYSYCIENGIPNKLLPMYCVRDEIQELLHYRDYENDRNKLYSRVPLFIDCVDTDDNMYNREEIRKFSNFIYDRQLKALPTIICLSKPLTSCDSLTPFLKVFLSNKAHFIIVKE